MSEADGKVMECLGGKQTFLTQRYQVPPTEFVGRTTELNLIIASWMTGAGEMPMAPLLVGEPGVGKNRIIYEAARVTGKSLFIFQGHEDVTAEDLACSVRFSDDPDRKMDYVASPLVTAMAGGGICFIDEIAKIRPRALALLVSVLDERRYIDSILLGARVAAHPGFRFVAATNTADLEGNLLPEFLRSRLRPVIHVGHPSREEIQAIVSTRLPHLSAILGALADKFWTLWKGLGKAVPPTPRDTLQVFALAMSLSDYEALGRIPPAGLVSAPVDLLVRDHAPVEIHHLEKAFREIFGG